MSNASNPGPKRRPVLQAKPLLGTSPPATPSPPGTVAPPLSAMSPPPLPPTPPPLPPVEQRTRTCEWCASIVPEQAFRCPSCHEWRNDIKRARRQVVGGSIGGASCALMGILCGSELAANQSASIFRVSRIESEVAVVGIVICVIGFVVGAVASLCGRMALKQKTGSSWPF
jgi:hypothetical protein